MTAFMTDLKCSKEGAQFRYIPSGNEIELAQVCADTEPMQSYTKDTIIDFSLATYDPVMCSINAFSSAKPQTFKCYDMKPHKELLCMYMCIHTSTDLQSYNNDNTGNNGE